MGAFRVGVRLHTRTHGGTGIAPWSPPGCLAMNGRPGDDCGGRRRAPPASWPLSTAIQASTWWTRSPPALRCGFVSHYRASNALITSTAACAPRKRRPCLGAMHCRMLSPFGGRSGTLPEGSFEGLRRPPEWAWTLRARSRLCVSRGSRVEVITPDADPKPQWARTRWTRRPASPLPVPVLHKAGGSDQREVHLTMCTPMTSGTPSSVKRLPAEVAAVAKPACILSVPR